MKKQKPIEHDVHLKYMCPKCGYAHWLSFQEASTKNYKIVCDCNTVFGVKRTKTIKIVYADPIIKTPKPPDTTAHSIDDKLLNKTVSALVAYGFTKQEAIDSITKTYNNNPTSDHLELVKQTLASMRV